MKRNTATLPERRFRRGLKTLVDGLGLPDALRFIVDLERGKGDSVRELKAAWRGKSARHIYDALRRARNGSRHSVHPAA
jgi:hypothetical protein